MMGEQTGRAQALSDTIAALRSGKARSYKGLAVLPLLSSRECAAKYVLLDQAISRGALTVTEVSEAGAVPYLTAANRGPWPVLIFDGEELTGAKQNRICNATILVSVGESVLPVSCVEEGRWSRQSASFCSGVYAAHPSLRMEKESLVRRHAQAHVEADGVDGRSQRESQGARAARYGGAQLRVWEHVVEVSACLGVDSDTSALADNFTARGGDLNEYVNALSFADERTLGDIVGVAVFFEGRFVCVDLLQPSTRFRLLYPKLLRGYALEALVSTNKRDFFRRNRSDDSLEIDGCDPTGSDPAGSDPADLDPAGFDPEASTLRLFAQLKDAVVCLQTAVDLGEDLRVETAAVSGAGLVWNEEMVQFSLFPRPAA